MRVLSLLGVLLCGVFVSEGAALSLLAEDSLEGWYTFIRDRGRDQDPKAVFTVAEGVLRISGEEVGLYHERSGI